MCWEVAAGFNSRIPLECFMEILSSFVKTRVMLINSKGGGNHGWMVDTEEMFHSPTMFANRPIGVVVQHIAVSAGGVRFDSRADQIGHSAVTAVTTTTTAATFLRSCFVLVLSCGDGPAARLALRRDTAIMMI